jgi:hypothetical protein
MRAMTEKERPQFDAYNARHPLGTPGHIDDIDNFDSTGGDYQLDASTSKKRYFLTAENLSAISSKNIYGCEFVSATALSTSQCLLTVQWIHAPPASISCCPAKCYKHQDLEAAAVSKHGSVELAAKRAAGQEVLSRRAAKKAKHHAEQADAPKEVLFDTVFPQLFDACAGGRDGGFVIGRSDHPYAISYCFNCGGELSGVDSPLEDGVNGILQQMEEDCYSSYPWVESLLPRAGLDPAKLATDAERLQYDFAALHPKIAAFVSFNQAKGSKRSYIQIGSGHPGAFGKALTGKGKVVWQSTWSSPAGKKCEFPLATVLREMEDGLP